MPLIAKVLNLEPRIVDNEALAAEVEQLEQQLAKKKSTYEDVKAKVVADIVIDPMKVVSTKISDEIVDKINNDDSAAVKISEVADQIVDHGIKANKRVAEAVEHRASAEAKDADFENNKSEYLHHGIDYKVQPWQSKLMIIMNNIWFVILSFIFFFSFIQYLKNFHFYDTLFKNILTKLKFC